MLESQLKQLQARQRAIVDESESARRAAQKQLQDLEKAYREAQANIHERMRQEAEVFSQQSSQTAKSILQIEANIAKAERKENKLQKHKAAVEQRQAHIAQLQSNYRASAAQLAHDFAVAAVEKVDPELFRSSASLLSSSTSSSSSSSSAPTTDDALCHAPTCPFSPLKKFQQRR